MGVESNPFPVVSAEDELVAQNHTDLATEIERMQRESGLDDGVLLSPEDQAKRLIARLAEKRARRPQDAKRILNGELPK